MDPVLSGIFPFTCLPMPEVKIFQELPSLEYHSSTCSAIGSCCPCCPAVSCSSPWESVKTLSSPYCSTDCSTPWEFMKTLSSPDYSTACSTPWESMKTLSSPDCSTTCSTPPTAPLPGASDPGPWAGLHRHWQLCPSHLEAQRRRSKAM